MLSIITVTRYRPELLAKAIDSLTSQTCQDFEWIVINDGCDPNTREVVTRYANFPHTYLEMTHPTTGFGLSIGRNRGLILAVGDIVTYLDDDNTFKPNFVEETIGFFDWHPQINYAMPIQQRRRIVVEQGQIIKQGKQFCSPTADCTIDELISHQQLIDSNGFTHRQVNSALDLAWNPDLRIYIDYEFFLRCICCWGRDSFAIVPEVLVDYIQSNLGEIGSSGYQQWAEEIEKISDRQQDYPCLLEPHLNILKELASKYCISSQHISAFTSTSK